MCYKMELDKILNDFDRNLKEYIKSIFPNFNKNMFEKSSPYKIMQEFLFRLYLLSSYVIDRNLIPKDKIPKVIQKLYVKASLSILGIYSCLYNGLPSEASIIQRSLFDLFLTVKIILEDNTEERMNLYENYQYIQQWRNIQDNKGILSQKEFEDQFNQQIIQDTEKKYNEVKANYHPKSPYHWAWKIYRIESKDKNPSIRFLCKKFGYLKDYVKIYSTCCLVVHGSPLIENIMTTPDGRLSIVPIFDESHVSLSVLSMELFSIIIKEIMKKYSTPENTQNINEYISRDIYLLSEHYKNNKDI